MRDPDPGERERAVSAGAILFLNPEVLLPRLAPTIGADGFPIYGLRNAPPQTNGSANRLNDFCRTVGAGIVLTRTAGLGDVLARLRKIGLRASMPLAWHTNPQLPDPADAIPAWLIANGIAPAVIVDRPGVAPAISLRVDVPLGEEITLASIQAVAAAFA